MAKTEQTAAPAVNKQDTPTDFPLALEEFCARLSSEDRRVEMIGGFYYSEKKSGHLRDTHANFMKRYQEFMNKPVQKSAAN